MVIYIYSIIRANNKGVAMQISQIIRVIYIDCYKYNIYSQLLTNISFTKALDGFSLINLDLLL